MGSEINLLIYNVISRATSVLVSLAQLIGTMYKICKIRGSNSGHHQKKVGLQVQSLKINKYISLGGIQINLINMTTNNKITPPPKKTR